MTKPTILVTGGAGFIGSQVCKTLAAAGFLPVAYDNLSNGYAWAVRWGPLERGDLRDGAGLRDVLRRHRPAAVMHFAALIEVGESVRDPARFYDTNVAGSLSLLEAMRAEGVDDLIFSSTAAVYGMPAHTPVVETLPLRPINPYGVTKMVIESMLADYAAAYGLRFGTLRYFNAAGGDPEADIGEAHDPESHLIPLVLDVALGVRPEIAIFGDDYPTPDGTCVRDYIHVCDLARAHLLALRRLLDGGESLTVNLGNGAGHSVREVIETARRVTGHPVPARLAPPRPGDPPVLVADCARAVADLGWRQERAALDVIVADAWRWRQRWRASPPVDAR
ncbi:UDP-glucose 4-epimerase GalE [Roseospira visakhapatnamensis]|uniref:UDP-glucose 4-epimerase n=1 Tax=Roseospira visakhapatnamensis TaxID=390880 RepID=A0A7W6RAW0_9PROT|nr:UDP-glucose 4-epimerase GalE [Roseospira visakhapatnamensis]MBB4265102.1 UDP-glucose-4-epimerase GalE [Roseospira visakhapatnamensis]